MNKPTDSSAGPHAPELQSVARELHDSIAQSLAAVNLMLQGLIEQANYPAAETRSMLTRAHLTSRTANAELRRLIEQLRASAAPAAKIAPGETSSVSASSQKLVALDRLRRLGLISALKDYFEHALAENVELVFTAISYDSQDLAVELALFRIAQEAISNAIRHGRARKICISISIASGQTQLVIEDDGCGSLEQLHGGVGLQSMRERAAHLGGTLSLTNPGGIGVALKVRIPVRG